MLPCYDIMPARSCFQALVLWRCHAIMLSRVQALTPILLMHPRPPDPLRTPLALRSAIVFDANLQKITKKLKELIETIGIYQTLFVEFR